MPESLLARQHAMAGKEEKLDFFAMHHQYQPEGALPANNLEQELATAELGGNADQQLNRIEFETLPRQHFKHSETLPIS